MQQELDTQRNEKLDLMITMEEHMQMRYRLTATIDCKPAFTVLLFVVLIRLSTALTKDKLELEAKCRKLHQQ